MSNGKSIRDAIKAAGDTPKKSNPYKKDVLYTSEGQWKYPGQVTKVPGGNITMQGVPYPVLGVDNHGNQQMMMPNMNYHFPGQYVTEYPIDLEIRGNLEHIHGNIGANFGRNRIDLSMGTPTHEFNPRFGVKYTRTFNYGGDPSLPAITGHYPFGGIHTKTHTHFRRGGWLDELQNGGGPNPGVDPPITTTASNTGAVNENELFDRYMALQKMIEEENKRVAKVRGNLMPAAEALDKADDIIQQNYHGPAYQAFEKANYAKNPKELREAIKAYPKELRDVLPVQGNYNLATWNPETNNWDPQRRPNRELYCTPYGCFTYQKAGAKDVPNVEGNEGFQKKAKEGEIPFKKVKASEAEPGDMALVIGPSAGSYTDPTKKSRIRAHHTTVLADKPKFDEKGNVIGFEMYNADDGARLNYKKQYRNKESHKDTDYEFYRYVGQTPKYEKELKNIKSRLASLPIDPMPIKAQNLLLQEEPELELRQTGGGYFLSNQAYDTIPETTGVYKRKIPSLDTLKKQAAKQAARPWKDWSPEEKERYIKNPPKKMTPAQAEEWNKRAEEWSSTQAKKEHTEDYIKESTRKAVVENPMWNTAVSFTPAGMIGSLMKGVANAGPDIYKTIKNPTSVTNYANIADDILSMAHIPESAIGFKSLANIKKIGLPGTNQGLTVGDVKKLYSTEKKFQKKEDTTGKKHPSGMTDAQISAYINKSYTPFGQMEEGGWLDEYFRGGSGPMMPPGLRKKVRKKGTSKNIQSSVNKLFLRNYDLFGPSGKNVYNPNSKYESGGGWLDNLE